MTGFSDRGDRTPFGPRRGVYVPEHGLAASTLRGWCERTRALAVERPLGGRTTSGHPAPEDARPDRRSPKEARVEAALLVADGPLSPRRLVQVARLIDATEARTIVSRLNDTLDSDESAFRIEWVAAGFQMLSSHRYAPWLERLHERRARTRLSTSALETLVIVAHRQPVTRADIDAVRGSQSAELLRQLMERGLLRIVGEEETLGRPYLYGTTRSFLETFGLRTLADLPMADELRRDDEEPEPVPEDDSATDDLAAAEEVSTEDVPGEDAADDDRSSAA